MSVPFSMPWINAEDRIAVAKVMKSGWISSLSDEVCQAELDFCKVTKARHAVSVSNGTVALHLSLAALDIGTGDEVIVPNLSFVASISVIRAVGARPVIVDIDPNNLGINADLIERVISKKTKAIIAVHLFGLVCSIEKINKIAKYKRKKMK